MPKAFSLSQDGATTGAQARGTWCHELLTLFWRRNQHPGSPSDVLMCETVTTKSYGLIGETEHIPVAS